MRLSSLDPDCCHIRLAITFRDVCGFARSKLWHFVDPLGDRELKEACRCDSR